MKGSVSVLVREFHSAFGLTLADKPTLVSVELGEARQRLLEEEVSELATAVRSNQLAEIAHELADVVYVAYGTAISYGIDLDAVLHEVHTANMTKRSSDGRAVVRDGKCNAETDTTHPLSLPPSGRRKFATRSPSTDKHSKIPLQEIIRAPEACFSFC